MVNLLTENVANNSLGSLGGQLADSGQSWALTGDPAYGTIQVVNSTDASPAKVATISDGGVNGYALVDCGGMPNSFALQFSFAAGATAASTVCLICCREANFVGLNMGLHLLITPTYVAVQIRYTPQGGPAGAFDNINMDGQAPGNYTFASGPLGGPLTLLPADYGLSMAITLSGNTLSLVMPDGVARSYTDPRFATLMGSKIGIQSKRDFASDGRGSIRSLTVDGTLPAPAFLDPIIFERTAVATQQLERYGTAPVLTAPSGNGDVVDCGSRHVLIVENDGGAPAPVTVRAQATYLGQPVSHVNAVVPAAAGGQPGRVLVPLAPRSLVAIRSGDDLGKAYVDYAAPAGLRRGVVLA